MTFQPPLFLSHGSPMLYLTDSPARRFLAGLAARIGRPPAIVVASAHWETEAPRVGGAPAPRTIHDFGGFPDALHRASYPAPGAPDLAARIARLLTAAGLAAAVDPGRGLDHGIWVPLAIALPEAEVPVVPLAIQPGRDPAHHVALGRALRPLADEGILVIGSGSLTHNLYALKHGATDAPTPAWVDGFRDWVAERAAAGDAAALADYRASAPAGEVNHPTDDHFLPFFVALGAAGEDAVGRRIHASVEYGALAMDGYAFTPRGQSQPLAA
ncbi:MAG: dioxygenase [Alphaproteobacteria bacterium]|nr:dioxygenase [Alphaproteobacteria bacterium]